MKIQKRQKNEKKPKKINKSRYTNTHVISVNEYNRFGNTLKNCLFSDKCRYRRVCMYTLVNFPPPLPV